MSSSSFKWVLHSFICKSGSCNLFIWRTPLFCHLLLTVLCREMCREFTTSILHVSLHNIFISFLRTKEMWKFITTVRWAWVLSQHLEACDANRTEHKQGLLLLCTLRRGHKWDETLLLYYTVKKIIMFLGSSDFCATVMSSHCHVDWKRCWTE